MGGLAYDRNLFVHSMNARGAKDKDGKEMDC